MVAAHVLDERRPDGTLTLTSWLVDGRASALFAVLAGVSLVLLPGRTSPRRPGGPRAAGRAARAWRWASSNRARGHPDLLRAAVPAGAAVPGAEGARAVRMGGGWLVVAPVVSHLVRPHLCAALRAQSAFDQLAHPGHLLAELLLTGYYPCLPGRPTSCWDGDRPLDLRSRRVGPAGRGGLAVAVVAFVVSRSFTEQPWVLRREFRMPARFGDVSTTDAFSTRWQVGMLGTTPADGPVAWLPWWRRTRHPVRPARRPVRQRGRWSSALCLLLVSWLGADLAAQSRSPSVPGDDVVALHRAAAHAPPSGSGPPRSRRRSAGTSWCVLSVGALFAHVRRRGPLEAAVGAAQCRRRHSMAGQVSITIGTPAATVRSNASASMTPSWNHTARAPDRDGLVGELAGRLRAPEDVDHVDGERHVGERGVALLARARPAPRPTRRPGGSGRSACRAPGAARRWSTPSGWCRRRAPPPPRPCSRRA